MLVARPAGRAEPLVAALRAAGAEPVCVPLITTAPLTQSPALRAALADLAAGGYDWVAVTSAAAVEALTATARAAGLPLRVAPTTRVAAVGGATAAALRGAGLPVHLVPDGPGSAAALAAAWPATLAATHVLLPCSDRAAPTLPDALRTAGHTVTVVPAYRTETLPVPADLADRLAANEIDAVLLTSPSTVRALADARIAPHTRMVAIGAPTANAARRHGLAVDAVAADPAPAGLVAALAVARGRRDRP